MKKIAIIAAVLLMGLSLLNARAEETGNDEIGKISLTINIGSRSFSEGLFKDVYPDTPITYGVDLGYKIMNSLEIFLHTDFLKTDGKTLGMAEDTTFKLTPLELGARYLLQTGSKSKLKLQPYLGAGLGYYMIKEENPIDILDEKKLGFFAEGGIRLYIVKSFFLDAKLKYVMLKSDDSQNADNIDGLLYMAGIGISF